MNTDNINRVEVIDGTGRILVRYLKDGEKLDVEVQDGGRTLKIFISGEVERAFKLGWSRLPPDATNPTQPLGYKRGNEHVWQVRDGWMYAVLVNGRYTGHKPFSELDDALRGN